MTGSVWQAAIAEAHKHRRVSTSSRVGRVLTAALIASRPLGVPAGHAVLTTTGRTSGLVRRIALRAVRRGTTVYATMQRLPELAIERPDLVSAWVRNIRADPQVRVRVGRRTYRGRAREIDDPTELRRARDALCDEVHAIDWIECLIHLRGLPSRAKIGQLHRYWFDTGIPVAIDLNP
jgi:deazaflavin-dependent oxidoreductase (nitroreductase family)